MCVLPGPLVLFSHHPTCQTVPPFPHYSDPSTLRVRKRSSNVASVWGRYRCVVLILLHAAWPTILCEADWTWHWRIHWESTADSTSEANTNAFSWFHLLSVARALIKHQQTDDNDCDKCMIMRATARDAMFWQSNHTCIYIACFKDGSILGTPCCGVHLLCLFFIQAGFVHITAHLLFTESPLKHPPNETKRSFTTKF